MGRRIVEIVETCDHGHPRDLSSGDWPQCIVHGCPGGSRRTLTEGEYVLIEKVNGEWPEDAVGPGSTGWFHCGSGFRDALDALAGEGGAGS